MLNCKHCGVEIKPLKFYLANPEACRRLGMKDYIIVYIGPFLDDTHEHQPAEEQSVGAATRDIDPFVTDIPEEKNSSNS